MTGKATVKDGIIPYWFGWCWTAWKAPSDGIPPADVKTKLPPFWAPAVVLRLTNQSKPVPRPAHSRASLKNN
eukprot:561404-Amphidinium_carterae.1